MDYAKRITRLRELRRLREEERGLALPHNAVVRERSLNEQRAIYMPPGRGLWLCCHDKPYVLPCLQCKRSQRDAQRELVKLSLKTYEDVT